eukprot:1485548-Rhodomonas_salina.1
MHPGLSFSDNNYKKNSKQNMQYAGGLLTHTLQHSIFEGGSNNRRQQTAVRTEYPQQQDSQ